MPLRSTLLVALALVGAGTAVAGCGSNDKTINSLKQTGTQLQQQGAALRDRAATIRQELAEGKITQEQADRELQQGADQIETTAKRAANSAIDAVKNNGNIPDSAKKQLDQAQQQLSQAGN